MAGIEKIEKGYDGESFLPCAIIYNIKHALELILKSLSVTAKNTCNKEHDLLKLSVQLKKEVKTRSKNLKELIILAKKYHNLSFWRENFRGGNFFDSENEAFRYPISSNGKYILDIYKINELRMSDIQEVKRDVESLGKLLPKIYKVLRRKNMKISIGGKVWAITQICSQKETKRKINLYYEQNIRPFLGGCFVFYADASDS